MSVSVTLIFGCIITLTEFETLATYMEKAMKSNAMSICYVILTMIFAVTTTTVAWTESDDPETLSRVVTKLDKLQRVTDEPHPMADSTAQLCKATFNSNIHEGNGTTAYCHVYVTESGKEQMASGKGAYPVGTVIVKAKLKDKTSDAAILFTVMRKMAAGFDAEYGDWEYAVLDGPSKRLLASGKIDSCIACHKEYSESDYVTRAYMKENPRRTK